MGRSLDWIPLSGILAIAILSQVPSHAAVLLQVEEVGKDVVITGSGTADITGLTREFSTEFWTNQVTENRIYAGPDAFDNGKVTVYSALMGPLAIGSDPRVDEFPAHVGSNGDFFGILADIGSGHSLLILPDGYLSGASLSGVSTFPSLSIAQLGLSPGQISTWNWGNGANADSLRLEVAGTPSVPAPAPLLGALAAFRMARGLRRRLRQ